MVLFELNPCKACWEKYKSGECNINTINSCITETAAAFNGIPSNNSLINTPADKNWQECINNMIKAENKSPCDLQIAMAPVFYQTPHYFPTLFVSSGNPEQALSKCIEKCSEIKQNKLTCIQNCKTDHSAIQEKKEKFIPSRVEKYNNSVNSKKYNTITNTIEKYDKDNIYDDYPAGKEHPVIFWIVFSIVSILLSFFIVFFIRILRSTKI